MASRFATPSASSQGLGSDRPESTGNVALEPLARSLPPFLRLLAPWTVIVVGRQVCLVAQRVPALVWLLRFVIRQRSKTRGQQRRHDPRRPAPPRTGRA